MYFDKVQKRAECSTIARGVIKFESGRGSLRDPQPPDDSLTRPRGAELTFQRPRFPVGLQGFAEPVE